MTGDLCTAPRLTSTLHVSSDKRNLHGIQDKCLLIGNPDSSWWHPYTSTKFAWPQPIDPGQQKPVNKPNSLKLILAIIIIIVIIKVDTMLLIIKVLALL
jgi:hypothetical protein